MAGADMAAQIASQAANRSIQESSKGMNHVREGGANTLSSNAAGAGSFTIGSENAFSGELSLAGLGGNLNPIAGGSLDQSGIIGKMAQENAMGNAARSVENSTALNIAQQTPEIGGITNFTGDVGAKGAGAHINVSEAGAGLGR